MFRNHNPTEDGPSHALFLQSAATPAGADGRPATDRSGSGVLAGAGRRRSPYAASLSEWHSGGLRVRLSLITPSSCGQGYRIQRLPSEIERYTLTISGPNS